MSDIKVQMPDGIEILQSLIKNSESYQSGLSKYYGSGEACLCQCKENEILKLAIKKRDTTYFLAAYPNTGSLHDQSCAHYVPIDENLVGDPDRAGKKEVQGRIYYTCTVKLSRKDKQDEEIEEEKEDVLLDKTIKEKEENKRAKDKKIGLNMLLHNLWADAGLCQWTGGDIEKRTWKVVREKLVESTINVYLNKKLSLAKGLYMPLPWNKELSDVIEREKELFFTNWRGKANNDFLVIGELKDIEPTTYVYDITIRHDNTNFYCSENIKESMDKMKFEMEVYSNNQSLEKPNGRVIVIMTCNYPGKYIKINSIAAIATSKHFIPTCNYFESEFFDLLVSKNRTFIRPTKYDTSDLELPDCVLLDTGHKTVVGIYDHNVPKFDDYKECKSEMLRSLGLPVFEWEPHEESIPGDLPPKNE